MLDKDKLQKYLTAMIEESEQDVDKRRRAGFEDDSPYMVSSKTSATVYGILREFIERGDFDIDIDTAASGGEGG